MPKIPELYPAVRGWLFNGPLAAHVPAYVARMREGRYAANTIARSLAAVAHFAHWMALSRLSVERLDESRVEQFLHEHLPHCGCAGPAMRHPREAHAALMPLLALLRQRGVISDLPSPSGPIAEELARYDAHMRDARGLDASTRVNRLRIVQRLLLAKFAGRSLRFERLSPDDIRRFIVFTVPQPIAAIAYQNKTVVYDILFRATAETLRRSAADPKHLAPRSA